MKTSTVNTTTNIKGYVNRLRKLNTFSEVLTEFQVKDTYVTVDKPNLKVNKVTVNNEVEIYG